MLHLAQVKKDVNSGQLNLQLLAQAINDHLWEINNFDLLELGDFHSDENLTEDLLLLVELEEQKIINIKLANQWVLELVKKYLTCPILNEEFIQKEQTKIEKWRQEMALQSQDLTRRNLELETRKEQLQELEEQLKQQGKQLEQLKLQLQLNHGN